jgi:hemerythrin-like domain-containing protein
MPVAIGQKKESDFSDPLGLLSDCHRRIEHFLGVLVRVSRRGRGGPLETDERAALEKAMAYFHNAAPKHTADEEDSLFPRLRASGRADFALDCLAGLEREHQTAARDHEVVETLATAWLNSGSLSTEENAQMHQALVRLAELYARHIAIEDRELFPLAARILGSEEVAEVGREMAERRGVKR